MTLTDDPVLRALERANPHPRAAIREAADDDHARAMLADIIALPAGRPRLRRDRRVARALLPVLSVVVVAATVAVVLHAGSAGRHSRPAEGARGVVVLRLASSAPGAPVSPATADREIAALRTRLSAVAGLRTERFARVGAREIAIRSDTVAASAPLKRLLTDDPTITFTDWEANVISPDGRTVAAQLRGGRPGPSQIISQGIGGAPPGSARAGGQTLYAAVRLASAQPVREDVATETRLGPESFAFAAPGTADCRSTRIPCPVAGPAPTPAMVVRRAEHKGVARPVVLTVPQGTTIAQAVGSGAGTARTARFFVLRDDAALTVGDLRTATASTSGQAASITGSFTTDGARAFTRLTATLAHRGRSLGTDPGFQHLAIIVGDRIESVPQIDYRTSPDGIRAPSEDFRIAGQLSAAEAQAIARAVRLGPLPLRAEIVR